MWRSASTSASPRPSSVRPALSLAALSFAAAATAGIVANSSAAPAWADTQPALDPVLPAHSERDRATLAQRLHQSEHACVEHFSRADLPIARIHINAFASNDPIEDRHVAYVAEHQPFAFVGCFDGHSGTAAAQFAADHLLDFTRHALHVVSNAKLWRGCKHNGVADALALAFLNTDAAFLHRHLQADVRAGLSGACTLAAYLVGRHLYVANAGDCRAILVSSAAPPRAPQRMADVPGAALSTSCSGTGADATPAQSVVLVALPIAGAPDERSLVVSPLSEDHHGEVDAEACRIRAQHPAEFDAIFHGRIKGALQPTRGLGDGKYKLAQYNEAAGSRRISLPYTPPYATAQPVVYHHKLAATDEFVVLACDGLWDAFSSAEVAQLVRAWQTQRAVAPASVPDNAATYLIEQLLLRASTPIRQYAADASPVSTLVNLRASQRRRIYDDVTVLVIELAPATTAGLIAASDADASHTDVFAAREVNHSDVIARVAAWVEAAAPIASLLVPHRPSAGAAADAADQTSDRNSGASLLQSKL